MTTEREISLEPASRPYDFEGEDRDCDRLADDADIPTMAEANRDAMLRAVNRVPPKGADMDTTAGVLVAKYMLRIGPDTTTGQMIDFLWSLAVEAFNAGEYKGIRDTAANAKRQVRS